MHQTIKLIICCIVITFIRANDDIQDISISIIKKNNVVYFNYEEFITKHNLKNNFYESKDKYEIVYQNTKIYLSPYSSFCKSNNNIYHLKDDPILIKNQLYIPLYSFYKILKKEKIPFAINQVGKKAFISSSYIFNINNLIAENKSNGSFIKIATSKYFNTQTIATSITSNNWLNITILGGIVDSVALAHTKLKWPIKEIRTVQLEQSAQISIHLDETFENIDVMNDKKAITIFLQSAIVENKEKIDENRKKWYIDTVVIDAGHGGKDPGAIGHNILEKDVTLDIALILGEMLERKLNVNVIYTRTEDVFIPLWKRTKIANEEEGKLFISIHANAAHPSIFGFETYLLNPSKSSEAIDIANRENGVIELEKDTKNYTLYSDENLILATMAQNYYMQESEELASLIQKHMDQNLTSRNRGIKQAGFHVLVGASMPNVLIEVGFLTNKNEAKQLNKKQYKRKIAESIFNAIKEYKFNLEEQIDS